MRIELATGTAAELALPAGEPRRGVVVAPDIGGLRGTFDDLCAQLAATHGWAVCAPEPFPGREAMPLEERLVTRFVDERAIGDLLAAADHLSGLGLSRVAVIGFCMGGMAAHKAAGTGRFDRAVAFYGMIREPEAWASPGNVEPLDALSGPAACPTLAIIAGLDRWTPPDDVAALRALDRVEVVEYPDADHGFVHDPSRPAHRPQDAADAWARVAAFLEV